MNNYCRNCGEKLEEGVEVCPKCEAEVFEERVDPNVDTRELTETEKKESKYLTATSILFILNILAYLVEYLFPGIIPYLKIVFPALTVTTLVVLVHGSIKVKESKEIRTILILFLILLVVMIIFGIICTILFLRFCDDMIRTLG